MATSCPPTYQSQLEDGQAYQDFVAEKLYHEGIVLVNFQSRASQLRVGENLLGLEIKYDKQFIKTGNLYIEIAEKSDASNRQFVTSGIYRDDNTWLYGIGNYDELFLFSKRTLRKVYEHRKRDTDAYKETPTSRGFVLPRREAAELAERCFGPWQLAARMTGGM